MSRQRYLTIITTLIACLLLGALSAFPDEGAVFWVAPSLEQCDSGTAATAKEQCNTLEGYQKNSSIFSISHSTWIFLKGEHHIVDPPIIVSGAINITWTGEEACALRMVRCAIFIPACKRLHNRQRLSHHTTIIIQNSQVIQLMFLMFSTTLQGTLSCNELYDNTVPLYPSLLTLRNISNAKISSTVVAVTENYLEELISHVEISNPRGVWLISQTVFSQTFVTVNITHCLFAFVDGFKCNFSANIARSIFHRSILATRTGASVRDSYNAVNITFRQSTIFRFHLELKDYSADSFCLSIMKCNFTETYFKVPVFLIPETQHVLVNILLWKVKFQCYPKSCNKLLVIEIKHSANSGSKFNGSCGLLLPNITMSHITVQPGFFGCHVKGPKSFEARYTGCNRTTFPVLTLHNCVFQKLFPVSMVPLYLPAKKQSVISIVDMGRFLVTWTGTNKILNNRGCGIVFKNSIVHNDGFTVIESNSEGGVFLQSNCRLLLSNNSVLQVFNNRDGGILSAGLAVAGTPHVEAASSLQLWPENYICFFQFVDIQGRYIHSFELYDFNASILVSHNKQFGFWRYATNNIWNGHFDNCLLQTQDGNIPVGNNTLTRTFGTDVKLEEEATLPYKICLCSSALASGNTSLWDCQQSSTISAYPGQAKLYVSLLADFNRTVSGIVSLVTVKNEMFFEVSNCTVIPLQWLTKPGETEVIVLELAEYYGDQPIWNLSHVVYINICECPVGLVHKTDDAGCSCNSVLNERRFLCSITSSNFTYKALYPGMWIGSYGEGNGSLAIGLHCPAFYCSDFIFQHGILLDEIHSRKQCQQQRTGIMCSECAEGTSSVFGSFHCRECSHGWVVLVFIFALTGVMIIALLFLFNFTILQGTIQGIVLYVNTLGLLNDFIEEHGVNLYIPIALMNFNLGFATCFFSGMDEFSKAILRFVFPLYLFTLLIVTITVVHKCGYRIFRFHFIARRAVPVLATIMLLTYTDLAGAVITGLRYTTIYSATSGERHVVWLYQPRLLYFRGQHLALGILSLAMALLYLIPFTFVMLFGDLLRRYIHKLWFSHFLDVLQGAFRWPLGFWAGLRLLLRMALIALSITARRTEFAICTALLFLALHLLQQCIKPFRVLQYSDEHYDAQLIRNKPHLWLKLKLLSLKPPTFDGIFLLNVAAVSAVVQYSTSGGNEVIVKVLISILLLFAILECALILIWHTYKFFPVSDKAVEKLKSFKMTLQLAFTNLVQRCHRRPKDINQDRGSPVPVFELRLLPPREEEFLESSASESETEEDVPVVGTRSCIGSKITVSSRHRVPRVTGQLQEPLLT